MSFPDPPTANDAESRASADPSDAAAHQQSDFEVLKHPRAFQLEEAPLDRVDRVNGSLHLGQTVKLDATPVVVAQIVEDDPRLEMMKPAEVEPPNTPAESPHVAIGIEQLPDTPETHPARLSFEAPATPPPAQLIVSPPSAPEMPAHHLGGKSIDWGERRRGCEIRRGAAAHSPGGGRAAYHRTDRDRARHHLGWRRRHGVGQRRRERHRRHHRHRDRSRCRRDAHLLDRRRRRCRQVHRRRHHRRAVVRVGARLREPHRRRRQQRLRRHRAGLRRHPDRHPGHRGHGHQRQRQCPGDHLERRRRLPPAVNVAENAHRGHHRHRDRCRCRRDADLLASSAAPTRRSSPSTPTPARCRSSRHPTPRARPTPAATTSTTSPCRSPTAP